MAQRDLYETLGVPRTATEKEIRKAYRELARKYHPDRNPGNKQAEEKFKEASFASETLLNADKRKLYDEFGEAGLREGFNADAFRNYQRAGGGQGNFGGFGNLEDLLRQMDNRSGGGRSSSWSGSIQDLFGGGDVAETIFGRQAPRARKRDLISDVTIEFAEAVRGTERELSFSVGAEPARTIKVRIPAGVRDDGRVRLRGQGEEGGDLVLHVRVKDHPYFRREGANLLLDLPVTVGEAFHGARVQVPTPEGSVNLRIPKGVRGGTKLRLKGKGVRHGSTAGDLIVQVQIVLPSGDSVAEAIDGLEKAYQEPVRKDIAL